MSKKKMSLSEEDITTERTMGRRGMLQMVGGTLLAGAAVTAVGAVARAENPSELANDRDPSDGAGRGRTGHTDRDTGGNGDAAGRGVCAERGVTDSDSGGSADGAGRGRGPCR